MSERDQGQKVRVGLKWVAGSLFLQRVVQFATTAILARFFLTREEYGVVWMTVSVIFIVAAVRELGFGQAFIQRQDADEEDTGRALDTLFVISVGINFLLFAVLFTATPWIADLFPKAPGLRLVMRGMFLAFLVEPFLATPALLLMKRMDFAKHSSSEILASWTNAAIAISLALAGFGVWCLVIAYVGSRVIQTGYLMRAAGWRPRFRYDRAIAGQLFGFGKFLWGSAVISAVGRQLDKMVIGRIYGATNVGEYGLAHNLTNQVSNQVALLVNRISFPAFSRQQKDLKAVRYGVLKALSHVAMVCFPLALGLMVVAEDFLVVIYGEKWKHAAPILQVLAVWGLILATSSVGGPALKAIGKPHVFFFMSIPHHAVLLALFWVFRTEGPVGIAWAVLLTQLLTATITFVLIVRSLEYRALEVLEPLFRTGSAALLMVGAVLLFQRTMGMDDLPRVVSLLSSIAVGAGTYVLASALLNRPLLRAFTQTVKEVVRARRA